MEEIMKCPYCGEDILAVARKCKHCGEWLNKESDPKDTTDTRTTNGASVECHKTQKANSKKIVLGIIIIFAILVVAIIAICFWGNDDTTYKKTVDSEYSMEEESEINEQSVVGTWNYSDTNEWERTEDMPLWMENFKTEEVITELFYPDHTHHKDGKLTFIIEVNDQESNYQNVFVLEYAVSFDSSWSLEKDELVFNGKNVEVDYIKGFSKWEDEQSEGGLEYIKQMTNEGPIETVKKNLMTKHRMRIISIEGNQMTVWGGKQYVMKKTK